MKNIRLAAAPDYERLLEIYAPFVRDTVVSFEYLVPTLEAFSGRISGVMKKYPWLVCEMDGRIAGYAYAAKHSERAAYDWSVDASVYIAPEFHRKGIATALYHCLFEILRLQGFYTVFAGYSGENEKSRSFHKAFGFKPVGVYHNAGYKAGRWHDVEWCALPLKEYTPSPRNPKPIGEIKETQEFHEIMAKSLRLIRE